MRNYNIFIDLKRFFLRICLIILDAELPLGSLYIVQRVLSCLSASCPKRIQILFSVALYFCKNLAVLKLATGRQQIPIGKNNELAVILFGHV